MASISTDANGLRKIQFADGNGNRKIVRLGKLPMKAAETILAKIEGILEAKLSRRALAPEVATWLGEIPDMLAKRLAAAGLIAPREKQQADATKLGEFIDAYLLSRTDIKPRTRTCLLQVRSNLVEYFGENKPLRDITPGDADEWRRWMLTCEKKLGDNTVRRRAGRAKQLFRAPQRKRVITENPFADMRDCTVRANKTREYFLSLEDTAKVLAACPDHEWRLIVTAWLGNSQLIAAKHYLQVTDEHFAKASHNQKQTHNQTHSAAEINEMRGNGVVRLTRDNEKGPEFPGLSVPCRPMHKGELAEAGIEPARPFRNPGF